jgi:hypothetical protein
MRTDSAACHQRCTNPLGPGNFCRICPTNPSATSHSARLCSGHEVQVRGTMFVSSMLTLKKNSHHRFFFPDNLHNLSLRNHDVTANTFRTIVLAATSTIRKENIRPIHIHCWVGPGGLRTPGCRAARSNLGMDLGTHQFLAIPRVCARFRWTTSCIVAEASSSRRCRDAPKPDFDSSPPLWYSDLAARP